MNAMWSTPRKPRGGRGGAATPSTPVRLKGVFNDGQWFCNCTPRKPAVKQQTKKAGPNKGRRFYTCQLERDNQCGFFLWEDMAQEREKSALFAPRTEPKPRSQPWLGPHEAIVVDDDDEEAVAPKTPSKPSSGPRQNIFNLEPRQRRGSESDSSLNTDGKMELEIQEQMAAEREKQRSQISPHVSQPLSSQTMTAGSPSAPPSTFQTPSRKRPRAASPEFSDDSGFDSDERNALIALEKTASAKKQKQSGSPSSSEPKSLRGDSRLPATPSGSFSKEQDAQGNPAYLPPTPVTRGTKGDGATGERTAKRARFTSPAVGAVYESPSEQSQSQSRSQARGAAQDSSSTLSAGTTTGNAGAADDENIADKVLDILADQPISAAVRRRVRDTLDLHARQVTGVRKGRDVLRTTLATKEGTIAALQERIADLENKRKMDRERMREVMASFDGE